MREHSPIGQPSLYGTWPWFPTMPPCVCGPIKFFASLHIAFRRWRIWESLQAYGRLHLWNESWVNLWYISNTWAGVFHIFQKWGSTSLFDSNQFYVLAWYALWFLRGDQVWYRARALVDFRKHSSSSNFEMFCTLFGAAIDWHSCLWYAITCLL